MLASTSLLINTTSPSSWLWRIGHSMRDYLNAFQLMWLITIKLWNWLDTYMTIPRPPHQEIPSARLSLNSWPTNAQMYSQAPSSVYRLWTSAEPLRQIWYRIFWNKGQYQRFDASFQAIFWRMITRMGKTECWSWSSYQARYYNRFIANVMARWRVMWILNIKYVRGSSFFHIHHKKYFKYFQSCMRCHLPSFIYNNNW